jgi:hypothetical protein
LAAFAELFEANRSLVLAAALPDRVELQLERRSRIFVSIMSPRHVQTVCALQQARVYQYAAKLT